MAQLNFLIEWWTSMIDFPALILLIIFMLGTYVLWQTQRASNDFDFADMLRDEAGKPSSARLAVFVCLGITSWGLMYVIIKGNGTVDNTLFLGYTAIWSGAKIAEKALDAWANRGAPRLSSSSVTSTTVASETTVVKAAD